MGPVSRPCAEPPTGTGSAFPSPITSAQLHRAPRFCLTVSNSGGESLRRVGEVEIS